MRPLADSFDSKVGVAEKMIKLLDHMKELPLYNDAFIAAHPLFQKLLTNYALDEQQQTIIENLKTQIDRLPHSDSKNAFVLNFNSPME